MNKFIIKTFLTSIHRIQLKYESSIHSIAFSNLIVISSESGEKYAHIKHYLQEKNHSKQIYSALH